MSSASPKHKIDHQHVQGCEPAFQLFLFLVTVTNMMTHIVNVEMQQVSLRFTVVFNGKIVVKLRVTENTFSSKNLFLWGHYRQREGLIVGQIQETETLWI